MKTIKDFAAQTHINEKLIRAVVRQVGGWTNFQDYAADVVNHGASAGFVGFTYYTDTCKFYAKNRALIVELAKNMASEFGQNVVQMVKGFRCLQLDDGNTWTDEIGATIYGNRPQQVTEVANALSWFALEEVCRAFYDAQNS